MRELNEQSNTNNTSTNESPRLEKFLVDSDCDPGLVVLLRRLGFRARSILTLAIQNDDTTALRWCNKNGYILVCHDKHKDSQTRYAFNSEMNHRGGRVIRVSGEPGQDALFALGKILAHRPTWQKYFAAEAGQAVVHPSGCNFTNAATLLERSTFRLQRPLPEDPKAALQDRMIRVRQPRLRKVPEGSRRLPNL